MTYTYTQKHSKHIVLLFIILCCSPSSWAQRLIIVEQGSHKAVAEASIHQKHIFLLSNAQGEVDISTIDPKRPFIIRHAAHQSQSMTVAQAKVLGYRIALKRRVLHLNEIVISASKWEQNSTEVPNKISRIQARDIAFSNPQTAADLLGKSHDVYIQKSQMGGGSPMIRGFASNRVLLVVDGVRMNNAIFRSGNLQNVISLDANAIQDAEVVFGPGSVMYGSDAIGGVMDFHTLSPAFAQDSNTLVSGKAMARWASANMEKTTHIDINIGRRRWSSLSSFTYSHYGDLRMGSHGHASYTRPQYVGQHPYNKQDTIYNNQDINIQKFTGYQQLNIMQKLAYKANSKLRLSYDFHYSRLSDVPRYDRLIQYKNNKLKYAQWYYGPQKWMLHKLQATYQGHSFAFDQAKLIVSYQNYHESRHDRKLYATTLRSRHEQLHIFALNADFDKAIGHSSHLFYGAEWTHNSVGSTGLSYHTPTHSSTPIASRYPDGATYSAAAAYANYKYKANEKCTLLAGARYSLIRTHAQLDPSFYPFPFQHISLSNGALNASVGGVYLPAPSWQIHINAATGFRAPNVDDVSKVFDSEPGHVVVPNPNLKPEYAYNAEISLVKKWGQQGEISTTAFYTLLKDAMVRRSFQFNGHDSIMYDGQMSKVQALINTDEAQVYGLQLSLKTPLWGAFSLLSKLNYTQGHDKQDKPLRHVPPLFGSTHLIYHKKQIKIDLYANYNGEISYNNMADSERDKAYMYASDKNGQPYSPSWITLNALASLPLNKMWQLSAGLENIFDIRYRPYSSGIVAPGRQVMLSVQMRF